MADSIHVTLIIIVVILHRPDMLGMIHDDPRILPMIWYVLEHWSGNLKVSCTWFPWECLGRISKHQTMNVQWARPIDRPCGWNKPLKNAVMKNINDVAQQKCRQSDWVWAMIFQPMCCIQLKFTWMVDMLVGPDFCGHHCKASDAHETWENKNVWLIQNLKPRPFKSLISRRSKL